jgi:excinuclease ABC subunit A
MDRITIRGAREHNLKNISIDIPRDKLVIITGLSGSGKSSLAFDTLYAEGQRRYVESLSSYARQFLELMEKPDVDSIEGLSPAVSIEQKTTSKNPRSTVGTITEIYDYLRLLFARIGIPYSPATGKPIEAQTVSQMADAIMGYEERTKILLLAPVVRGRKGEYRKEFEQFQKQGFQRVKVDGVIYDIDEVPSLNKNKKHTIAVVVDRLVIKDDMRARLMDSLETALKLSDGLVEVENFTTKETTLLSSKLSCPESGFMLEEVEPRLFSFNNPQGACPDCDGLGMRIIFDLDLIVPERDKSLAQGAIVPWSGVENAKRFQAYEYYTQMLDSICRHFRVSMEDPFEKLPEVVQKTLLYGSGKQSINMTFNDGLRGYTTAKTFEGVIPHLTRRYHETESDWVRNDLARFQSNNPCDTCHGHRLKPEALCVKIQGEHIGEITQRSIEKALLWVSTLSLNPKQVTIAQRILKEIRDRLTFLVNVGLGYLTLSRASGTLSGGESQRIRLASQIGSGLTGVLYVLDEPSIGLHQRDNDRLLETLKHLRDIGNTVVVVEHDEDAMRVADHIVDMGPGAGRHGGEVMAQGRLEDIMAHPKSLTGAYLRHEKCIPVPTHRRLGNGKAITIEGASCNNLKNVTTSIPLGTFTAVTGVSGGGKSTLILHTLYKAMARYFFNSKDIPGAHKKITGLEHVDKVIDIDQSPIGRTPRSNPATYIGCFTPIREWYAGLPEAKSLGFTPGRFSFNVKGGRCESCQGDGVTKIEMHFLPDVYVECDQCHGKRYNEATLSVKYKGKSIADVLDMTVDEAAEFFQNHKGIMDKLETLQRVGLGYIHLGQQATTLSGGEAQRVKLAKELSKRATGRTIYILDEPTTGLHFDDVRKLLEVLHTFVDQGNTVLVIEHNLDVIKTADYIIDLGPEGGDGGGEIIAEGTPEAVCAIEKSYTGQYLKPYLEQKKYIDEKKCA